MNNLMALGVAACLLFAACGGDDDEDQVGVALNWIIVSDSQGSLSCLEVEATTVEWTFRPAAVDAELYTFTYDCVDSGQMELIDSGMYLEVFARLKTGVGVVLSQCELVASSELSPGNNQIDQCIFELP